jgi:hypothetical protein
MRKEQGLGREEGDHLFAELPLRNFNENSWMVYQCGTIVESTRKRPRGDSICTCQLPPLFIINI